MLLLGLELMHCDNRMLNIERMIGSRVYNNIIQNTKLIKYPPNAYNKIILPLISLHWLLHRFFGSHDVIKT